MLSWQQERMIIMCKVLDLVLDLDTFGEIMDKFIKDNEIKMLITLPEGSIDPVIDDNVGAGSVMQFYIVLNALPTICKQLKDGMGIDDDGWRSVAETLSEMIKKEMLDK